MNVPGIGPNLCVPSLEMLMHYTKLMAEVTADEKFQVYKVIPSDTTPILYSTADRISKEFGGHAKADDLVQEVWLWIGNHPAQVNKDWLYESRTKPGTTLFGYKSFKRDIARIMVDYARAARIKGTGSDPDDEVMYSQTQIEQFMPFIWHTSVLAEIMPERPRVSQTIDPKFGGNSQTSIMDLRIAYDEVIEPKSTTDQVAFLRYAYGYTQTEIAETLGVGQQYVSEVLKAFIKTISRALNGSEGYGRTWSDPEALNDGPGSRKAMSNAEAQKMVST